MKTIEEKAKAYDEIIERAKTMLAAGEVMYGKENNASQLITDIIPELRESEDERIIEEIKFAIMQMPSEREDTKQRCLAYLERQKEHVPKNEESGTRKEQKSNPLCGSTEEYYREAYYADQPQKEQKPHRFCDDTLEAIDKAREFDEQEQKPAWSEEDIEAFVKSYSDSLPVFGEFQAYHDALVHAYRQGVVNTLKSLRPSWRPSEEQLKELCAALTPGATFDCDILNDLYEQLKKL